MKLWPRFCMLILCEQSATHSPYGTQMKFDASINAAEFTAEDVLKRVREEEIVRFYFGIEVVPHKMICSPLRQDKNPTCNFSYHKGQLKFRDWSEARPRDVWDLVGRKLGLSYYKTVERVAKDLAVKEREIDPSILEERKQKIKREKSGKSNIRVKRQDFKRVDKEYLKQYGLHRSLLEKFNVFSCKYAWLNTKMQYSFRKHDPCLAYYFGTASDRQERWKLYFYHRGKTRRAPDGPRFMCNTNRIQGWIQLPEEGEIVCFTKSLKDVMVLDRLGIPAIAMQGETTEPYPEIIEELETRFSHVVSLYDYDLAGVRMANRLREKHGITPFFLTDQYEGKDISDYVKYNSLDEAQKLIDFHANELIRNTSQEKEQSRIVI